jgi:hypothetical protein
MSTKWIFLIVGAIIAISILVELITGKTRLRGCGVFERKIDSGKYWLSIFLKIIILFLVSLVYAWGPLN